MASDVVRSESVSNARAKKLLMLLICFPNLKMGSESTRTPIKLLILLVPQEGFEPPTPSLRMRCSTS
jgi:hypothetical protein